jgi:hypothetical protein
MQAAIGYLRVSTRAGALWTCASIGAVRTLTYGAKFIASFDAAW